MNDYGILAVNKPAGITSFDVIRRLRKITGIRKMGHAGTLDPFASGLMIICLGKYTRIIRYLENASKKYKVDMVFGIKTDTGDVTGEKISEGNIPHLDDELIRHLENKISGLTHQIPPRYSALKVDGQRAYDLARKGKDFELPPRPITIHDFRILSVDGEKMAYRAVVSKGTYIRSLTEDIAGELGTVATTVKLIRLGSGKVELDKAADLEDLNPETWISFLIPVREIFPEMEAVSLDDIQETNYLNGNFQEIEREDQDRVLVYSREGIFRGIGKIESGVLKPKLVIK